MPLSSHHHPLSDLTNNSQELVEERMDIDPIHLTMSDVEFGRITEMLVVHMRREEALHGEEEDWKGVKQSQLVEWFEFLISEFLTNNLTFLRYILRII